jgi:biphenyl 2,3-dioxygenase ferredoxin reductase component
MTFEAIVVVGAGLAGATVVRSLRGGGYEGGICLIGDEAEKPYDRTTLSKSVLADSNTLPPGILDASWYEAAKVDLKVGERVARVDTAQHQVHLSSGESIEYTKLVLAMGARARPLLLEGSSLAGIHTLRTHRDCHNLRREFSPGRSLVIVGGGLIGCEVATTARKAGVHVTLLESAGELLLRVLGWRVGSWLRTELERLGVRVELNANVAKFLGTDRVNAVACSDGRQIPADTVLVSIGADPDDGLASEAGIQCQRGVVVNAVGESSCPGVYAVGDVAAWPLKNSGQRSLETYLNSTAQADAAVGAMLGNPQPIEQIPISWTEIAGHKLQMMGDPQGPGELITRGAGVGAPGATVLFRVAEQRVEAAIAINAPKEFSVVTRLVSSGRPVTSEQLQDASFNLRNFLKT